MTLKAIQSTKEIMNVLGVCANTMKKNYIQPLLLLEKTTGIKSGIIIGGTNKKPSYRFITSLFLEAVQRVNKEDLL
jgi:hypothetical protein